ncbi:MAG: aminotransferase class I/II-fold pyridoxal phosphate-dependent enzyme, partial [Pseudomonadota bacterium]
KIYGLAALRLGWAYGPANVIDAIHRVRGPFNVSAPAQAAGAAAIGDQAFVDQSVAYNTAEGDRVASGLAELGLEAVPGVANFVLIRFTSPNDVASADAFLRSRNLVLRRLDAYGLPDCIRLTIGPKEANTAVLEALAAWKDTHV